MRHQFPILLCAMPMLLAGLAACQPNRGTIAASSKAEAEALLIRAEADAWFKAIAAKDLEKTLSFYAPEAQYLAAGHPAATTPEERRRLWVEDYGTPGFSSDEVTTALEVARSGDLAYQRGNYVVSVQDEKGNMSKSQGKFVVIWKKQIDGQWKAIVDIDNADQ
jgi:ketosteroid isomerase-like protein